MNIATSTISADKMSLYPQAINSVVYINTEEGLLVDGLAHRVIFRGPLAHTILPTLVDHLDGSRNLRELIDKWKETPLEYLELSLSLLEERRLLRWRSEPATAITSNPREDYFERANASLRTAGNIQEIDCSHRDGDIAVWSDEGMSTVAGELCGILTASGISAVNIRYGGNTRLDADAYSLSVFLERLGSANVTYEEGSRNHQRLRVALSEHADVLEIGPRFGRETHDCDRCFRATWCGLNTEVSNIGNVKPPTSLALSIVAKEILYLDHASHHALGHRLVQRYRLPYCSAESLQYSRLPGCDRCRESHMLLGSETSDQSAPLSNTAIVYEERMQVDARIPAQDIMLPHDASVTENGATTSRVFPDCESIPLPQTTNSDFKIPTLRVLDQRPMLRRNSMTVGELSTILGLTAGFKLQSEPEGKRWCATAGNLGSVDLFVVARAVKGLSPGIYFYQSSLHSLSKLESHNQSELHDQLLGTAEYSQSTYDAILLFASSFARLAPKYRLRAYNLAQLDVGVATSQARLVSYALKIPSSVSLARTSSPLAECLGFITHADQFAATIVLAGPDLPDFSEQSASVLPVETESRLPAGRGWRPASSFRECGMESLVTMLMQDSAVDSAAIIGHPPIRTRTRSRYRFLPDALVPGESVGSVLRRRRSVRSFGSRKVTEAQIHSMITHAHEQDCRGWAKARMEGRTLQFTVLVGAACDIEPGAYEYSSEIGGLTQVRQSLSAHDTAQMFVQDEWSAAPVIVLISGDLGQACSSIGALGHRELLFRAGMAGHCLWMVALALGLDGCLIGGIVKSGVENILGNDQLQKCSLFAFGCGYPTTTSPNSTAATDF